ncbi:MAG: AraC family transcriptional regulator [Cyclobacteriaceae bacterium]|nr:AraC family transcriptional regulator [Cyclobacteriaceae bacterium]
MDRSTLDIAVKKKLESEQLFKISRFKEVIKRTKPHKHDAYFELIYLSEGAGFHWIDTKKFQITPPVVFFLSGQLHYWEMTAIPKGYVMLFREGFFLQKDLLNLIRSLEDTVFVNPSQDDNLDFIFGEMEKEFRNPSLNSIELIKGYLRVALVKLLRHKEQMNVADSSHGQEVFRKFQHFIYQANPVSNLKVNQAANHLGLSPQNLNAICRKVSGKSASELITEQVILEAKRYLIHSDKNISEIAFTLNFSDPSHFVKYFKKAAGETPQTFRSRHFQ